MGDRIRRIERRERLALRNKKSEKYLETYWGLIEGIGMTTYFPMDFAKTL